MKEEAAIPKLNSRIYPLCIPLPPDEGRDWKIYPVFKGPTAALQSLSCHVSVLIKNHSPHLPHAHREEEILLLLSGEVDIILPDEQATNGNPRRRLKTGQFVYYPAYFAHTIQTVSEEPANYLMFKWHSVPKKADSPLRFGHFNMFDYGKDPKSRDGFYPRLAFEGPTQYLKRLHCHTSTLTQGGGYEPHVDSYDVAIIVLEGEVETLGQRVKPHSVIFYAADEPHGMLNPGESMAKYIVFEFHGRRESMPRLIFSSIPFLLKKIKDPGRWRRKIKGLLKNADFYFHRGMNASRVIARLKKCVVFYKARALRSYTKPYSICIDASSTCQLKCPACPVSSGAVAKGIGSGFLRLDNFKKIIDKNPRVLHVELSNWGEIFLNPELKGIIEYAYKKNVVLTANNGVNLNTVSDDILESLVKYRFHGLVCSIDGASQGTYSIYRVNGSYDKVIDNIKKINYYKEKYGSDYPLLVWQFIAFGHNEQEISKARTIAKELKTSFRLKLNWDDLYTSPFSPVKDRELIKRESGLGVADRQEFEKTYGRSYINRICLELWLCPRVNYDGKLLGCSINHWKDFGNVFEKGLEGCLNAENMNYAKQMLLGLKEAREDIPCSSCKLYEIRKKNNSWINLEDLKEVRNA